MVRINFETISEYVKKEESNKKFFPDEKNFLFALRMYSTDLKFYENEIVRLGFQNLDRVLDAGCGYGQWSLPLSFVNNSVVALDVSSERINFVESLRDKFNIRNLDFLNKPISGEYFERGSFQGIFSYGVVYCTDWKVTLSEFYQLLAPGGSLFFNFVSLEWFIFLWETQHNKCEGYDPRQLVIETLINTEKYNKSNEFLDGQLIMEEKEIYSYLQALGFIDIQIGEEGSVDNGKTIDFDSARIIYKKPTPGLFEVIARKS